MIELNAHGYTAWIDPARGGSCTRLSRYGAQALRTPAGEESYRENAFLWGTPLLFFPNRISQGRFFFENRAYAFPVNEPATGCFLHGTLHQTPFEEISRSESAVALRYAATPQAPYLSFPHAFTLELLWHLAEDGLHQRAVFTNDSPRNMPVALAFHTTFCCPFVSDSRPENIRLTLDTSLEYSRDMRTYLPDGGCSAEYAGKEEMKEGTLIPCEHTISRLFRMGERREMLLTDARAGLRVRYRAGSTYGYWMVYNGGNPNYLCVEPQSWLSNCPNAPFPREQTGFDFLAPGHSRAYETCLSLERI